jgi:hypothetical protein
MTDTTDYEHDDIIDGREWDEYALRIIVEDLEWYEEMGGPIPDDHILHMMFECRLGYQFRQYGMYPGCYQVEKFGHPLILSLGLSGDWLSLEYQRRLRVTVNLNDPSCFDQIQQFLDSIPVRLRGLGVSPICLRNTEEALS